MPATAISFSPFLVFGVQSQVINKVINHATAK
jgi:hypothetical protein